MEFKTTKTVCRDLELIRTFLSQYDLEWLVASGSHYVFYDSLGEIAAISAEFDSDKETIPLPEQVVGQTVKVNTDGSIYVRVRCPKEGYWICYSRKSGDRSVTITVQRMNLNPG
jgi:hypothetical protein